LPQVGGGMLSGGIGGSGLLAGAVTVRIVLPRQLFDPTVALEISRRAPLGLRPTDPGELRQVCGRSGYR
jgi:hypothetical protein